jgi:dissimilatory sulfite reductase (desulfoviridin) alpha/beta subunit
MPYVTVFDLGQSRLRASVYHQINTKENNAVQSSHLKSSLRMSFCRGLDPAQCRFALPARCAEIDKLVSIAERCGWQDFLLRRTNGTVRAHDALRLAVSACANGCSRPHIADFAVIRAQRPVVEASACSGCGLCVDTCPDDALSTRNSCAVIDADCCLSCGRCMRACPAGAIAPDAEGYRVLVGGRLGRRPKLARELPGILTWIEVENTFCCMLDAVMNGHEPGMRHAKAIESWPAYKEAPCVC